MKSVLEISLRLFVDSNFKYLLTYKLSQDLETFFSAIRNRGGFNNNPTAKQFIAAYKWLLLHTNVEISKYANNAVINKTSVLNISIATLVNNIDDITQHCT